MTTPHTELATPSSTDYVSGVLNYLADKEQHPVSYNFKPPSGVPARTGTYAKFTVPIHSARAIMSELSLDRQGFAVTRQQSAVANFYDADEVRKIYYPEVERMVREFIVGRLDPDALAGPVEPGDAEQGGKRRVPGVSYDHGQGPVLRGLLRQGVEGLDRLGRGLAGDDQHQVEGLGVRPRDEVEGTPRLPTSHPLFVGAQVVCDIGAEGGKDPVRKENPIHPGNLPEGPI